MPLRRYAPAPKSAAASMKLNVLHRTRYRYRQPVIDSYNELRLRPASDDPGRVVFSLLNVNPPVRLRHFRDEHRNYVHWFEVPEPHDELLIEARTLVNTSSQRDSGIPRMDFPSLRRSLADEHRPFLNGSRYVSIGPEVWRLALDVSGEIDDVLDAAHTVMEYIHREWEYQPNATTASTHMEEVLHNRRGVCQDFAHVMIGLCRSLRIPARYVSGYLYNGPEAHLRGAQASHAWCEVFLPGHGWFGFDPTNNIAADERHIKIATGRDYDDAAPVRGHFTGPPGVNSALEVTVRVERAE